MGYQSPAAKAAKTQEGEGKIIGVVVADHFFDENTFYNICNVNKCFEGFIMFTLR